jgi:hypothetical protein
MSGPPYERLAVITGMPRSGTSWIGQIVDSSPDVRYRMSPLFSYELKGAVEPGAPRAAWEAMLARAYASTDEYMDQRHRRAAGDYPTFADKRAAPPVLVCKFDRFQDLVPEMLDRFPDMRAVAVVRHPCGAVHSWLTAGPKEFPVDADPMEHWRSGACKKRGFGDRFGFDDWKETTRLFARLARERPAQVRVERYEAFVDDALARTRALFAWMELPVGAQTEAFVARSQAEVVDRVYSVFKPASVKDRWRTELQPAVRDAILAELAGTDLAEWIA